MLVARLHGIAVDADQLRHEQRTQSGNFQTKDLLAAAGRIGLKAKATKFSRDRLASTPFPAIAADRAGRFFVVARVQEQRVLIHDPAVGRPETWPHSRLEERDVHEVILVTSRASIIGELRRFDVSWFIPAIVKYRHLLGEVLVVSLFLQFFALATPLFFQVVMDKVLVHRAFSTLDVIACGLLLMVVFEVTLSALRSYIFAHTTSRIDVELGARLFRHLVSLPLGYFHARRVGDSVARVRELENIRSFITGSGLTLVLDALFATLFLSVMFAYSPRLTLIVVASLPCYALVSFLVTPILRHRLREKFARGADNQAFLVETISGIDTVKAMAVEPRWQRTWETQLAAYITSTFRVATIATGANSAAAFISRVVTVATLYVGAKLVIAGDLTVGQLIAFNMLSANVSQPIMRLAQMWTDFQQFGISIKRLADILDAPTEVVGARTTLPPIRGRIELRDVVFRYSPNQSEVLKGVSLVISPGEIIGIVGSSGSGKSTVAKLIQRLHVPEQGQVLIDGVDLSLANPASIRRQIGVVLQESVLFNRTVRENIALADTGCPLEAVLQAAQLAGAHEFIVELPEGYDTLVGEHGANLSGGQRQRLSIARALLPNPPVLIFDEATSALDYDSERMIQNNMRAICRSRTVIVIAHRLTAVRNADRIIVIDRGRIVEVGPHAELVRHEAGYYSRLHRLQQGWE